MYLAYIYILVLLLGSFLPFPGVNETLSGNYTMEIRRDYLVHVLLYLPLPAIMLAGFGKEGKRNLWISLGTGLALAVLFEWIQNYLPYRAFNLNDLLANGIGYFCGCVVLFFLPRSWYSDR